MTSVWVLGDFTMIRYLMTFRLDWLELNVCPCGAIAAAADSTAYLTSHK